MLEINGQQQADIGTFHSVGDTIVSFNNAGYHHPLYDIKNADWDADMPAGWQQKKNSLTLKSAIR